MNYQMCLACGNSCPAEEIIGGRCDECAASGRQIDKALVTTAEHRKKSETASRRAAARSASTDDRQRASDVFRSVLEAQAQKQEERKEIGLARCEAIVKLNSLMNELSYSRFEINGVSRSLPKCWALIGTYSDDVEPELQVELGEVSCVETELCIEVDFETGLTGWLDTTDLWAVNVLSITAHPAPLSKTDSEIKLDINTRSVLLDLQDGQLVVWRLDPDKFDDSSDVPDMPPGTIKFAKSRRAEKTANEILAGEADDMSLYELEELGEISSTDLKKLADQIGQIRESKAAFMDSLDVTKAAQLQSRVYGKIRQRLYWEAVETTAYRAERPKCPKERHTTRLADSADTAFRIICRHIATYLQSNLGRENAAGIKPAIDWEELVKAELEKHSNFVEQEIEGFRMMSLEQKLANLRLESKASPC